MANNAKGFRTGLILLGLAGAAGAAYLGGRGLTQPNSPGQTIPVSGSGNQREVGAPPAQEDGEEEDGLKITLSDGSEQPGEFTPLPVEPGQPLSLEEINTILLRLPPLATEPDDRQAFKLPDEVLPPPRTGETLSEVFPPPPGAASPEVAEGPLEVLRYSPEGEVPIAAFVNVTFNQPMVPLSTLEQLSNEESPVQIEPAIPGTWRWLGTKTLNFQYDSDLIDRMPMATEYTVTVPAGTTSQTGGELAETLRFSFRTPPPTLIQSYPNSGDPQPLDPLFFVAFDQRVDPEAVLETIQVEAEGGPVQIQLASDEEVAADEDVNRLVEGRWLVFKASEFLPKASTIRVEIGPGTPSAEGPLTTQSSQVYSFQTYAPLEIVKHGCSWYDGDCPPLTPLYIEFNNPIEATSYREDMLRVEPEIPGVTVNIVGKTITLRGATQGRTTYRVTVGGEIEDVFGQTLGRDRQLTFRVGPAEPFLSGPDSIFVTLDPASEKPALSLYVMNYNRLDLQVYAVEPADWDAFKLYLQEYQRTDQSGDPPGRLVRDEVLRIDAPADKLTEVSIDLSDELDGQFGHFIVIAKPPKGLFEEERYWEHVQVWVQVTHIGLDAFIDHSEMVAWTTSLADGAPLPELTVEADSGTRVATTGPDGTARFPIPSGGTTYLLARQGEDASLLPANPYLWSDSGWTSRSTEDELRWYVIDDRQMYRPGEEVHVKGWLRLLGRAQDGDVGLVGSLISNVSYQVYDPQGNDLGTGSIEVNALGGFDFNFSLPENANLGYAYIQLDTGTGIPGRSYSHNFQIQEFRRPEFEVTARNETTGPYFVGGSATVAVEAKYFVGGPLPNAEVNWLVGSTPTNYSPPNWPDFTFGIWQPWWWYFEGPIGGGTKYQNFTGTTDATGNHYLDMDFESSESLRPYTVTAEATVFDVNRQAWAGSTDLLVHPADLYVGMRSERYFVERGQPLEIALIVTDLDGNAIPGREFIVTAARLEWKFENGEWNETEVDQQECNVESTEEPVTCEFETPIGGRYRITATIEDDEGRGNISQITRWVSGGELPPSRDVEQEEATLIPDKDSYQPGDVAEILVQSPFVPAEGLLTVSRNGLLYTERFEIEEGSYTLRVPIEDAHIPNLNVQVDLVGSAPRTDDQGEPLPGIPDRPAYATGALNLSIPPLSRTLELDVMPEETELEPGAETTLDLALKDANGEPVPDAELAVIVVDEAILALTNYQLTDPIAVFYTNRPSDMSAAYSRASIILADPTTFIENAAPLPPPMPTQALGIGGAVSEFEEALPAEAPAAESAQPMATKSLADDRAGAAQTPITVRSDFNPLAIFAPDVRTDENGEATLEVKLPDNLTRYRVMVVAVDDGGSKFGSAEANLTARLPLMVRPSAPRFLNFGDTFELPIVLQNQTDESLTVDVAIETANTKLTSDAGLRVEVPANDRIEVRFPSATDRAGIARFQVAAVSGSYADAASGELPVYTPATTEAFATYGVIDEGAIAQPVAEPQGVFPQFGGLEIQTSSTALQALTDAVIYLVDYPYECAEQIASRVLGVAALRDVLTAFESEELPSAAEMESAVSRDIELLQTMQNFDGGFPYWRRGQESIPFNTIHVAHALVRAQQKGFDVPQSMQDQLLPYLQNIENYYPHWYSLYTRRVLSAYAMYVRDLMGDNDPAKARALLNEAGLEDLSLEAVGWIWQVLVDDPNSEPELESIRRYVSNRAVETAGAANFTTTYDDQTYLILSSDRRTDAVLLDAMIADDPDADLIPKLVNGLLAHRTRGHWRNTQENVFVLLALDRYFNTYEAQTPDFVARIWLGETYAGEHVYEGRSTERHQTTVPMSYLTEAETGAGTQDLIIQKDGAGRLYYRLGLKYAPVDLWLDPLDMGFVVQREYEGVDDPEDVYRDEEGVWHIKAGARVRVHLTMVADNRRYHVALVDPLPAGLEIVNPALAVSQSIPQDPTSPEYESGWWWWRTWYEHQNMRDERAEAFTSLLWDGVYDYTYIARATTPGKFVVPPAKAEEMYSPEVFGRSGSDWVIVE